LSFKHQPTICINDLSSLTALHGNKRKKAMFFPNDGRIDTPTEANLQAVKEGTYVKNMPFLATADYGANGTGDVNGEEKTDAHPHTHTSHHYIIADEFHKGNMKGEDDKLRDKMLVPELRAINTQVAEQLNSVLNKDLYSICAMRPEVYMLMMRHTIDINNCRVNTKNLNGMKSSVMKKGKKGSSHVPSIRKGDDGRIIFTTKPGTCK
jgi:hypothetical protein